MTLTREAIHQKSAYQFKGNQREIDKPGTQDPSTAGCRDRKHNMFSAQNWTTLFLGGAETPLGSTQFYCGFPSAFISADALLAKPSHSKWELQSAMGSILLHGCPVFPKNEGG